MFNNPYIKLLRVNHWFKNISIYLGLGAFLWLEGLIPPTGDLIIKSSLAFLLASLISSVNYIINQIMDAKFDVNHPEKKLRPIPSGKISFRSGLNICVILILVSAYLTYTFFNYHFSIALILLFVAGILYNIPPIRLKDVPYLDVVAESINNPIRFLIGWFIFSKSSYPDLTILFLTWSWGAILMTAKRYGELKYYGKNLIPYRHTFKFYSLESLTVLMVFYSAASLIFLAYVGMSLGVNILAVWVLMLIFLVWLNKVVIGGKGETKSIESFVFSKKFVLFVIGLVTVLIVTLR